MFEVSNPRLHPPTGVSCKSPGLVLKERQADGSPALSWTMKRFLEPASRVRVQLYIQSGLHQLLLQRHKEEFSDTWFSQRD